VSLVPASWKKLKKLESIGVTVHFCKGARVSIAAPLEMCQRGAPAQNGLFRMMSELRWRLKRSNETLMPKQY